MLSMIVIPTQSKGSSGCKDLAGGDFVDDTRKRRLPGPRRDAESGETAAGEHRVAWSARRRRILLRGDGDEARHAAETRLGEVEDRRGEIVPRDGAIPRIVEDAAERRVALHAQAE